MSSTYGRSYWIVSTFVGSSWTPTGQIYRPNAALEETLTGTVKSINLADGSLALVTPEVTTVYEPITFNWMNIESTDAFLTTMLNYVTGSTLVMITDHLGTNMVGVWSDMKKTWSLDTVGDYFDVSAQFIRLS